jgi:hypothetical protein
MLDATCAPRATDRPLYLPYIQTSRAVAGHGENIPARRSPRSPARQGDRRRHGGSPEQFELVTAHPMEYFFEAKCDIVVLEVGMAARSTPRTR